MAFCSKCGEQQTGEEVRYCFRCGSPIHTPGPERPAYAPSGVPPDSERGQPYPALREKWRRFVQEIGSAAARVQPPNDRRLARIAGPVWIGGALLFVLLVVLSNFHGSSTPFTPEYSSYQLPTQSEPAAPRQGPATELSAGASPPVVLPSSEDEARQAVRKAMIKDREAVETLTSSVDGLSTGPVTDGKLDTLASHIRTFANDARETPLSSDCPRDFAESYYRYVSSLSELADAIDSHPHIPSDDEAALERFFRGLHGDPTGGVIELADTLTAYVARVRSAFDSVSKSQHEVEALAVRYGAQ